MGAIHEDPTSTDRGRTAVCALAAIVTLAAWGGAAAGGADARGPHGLEVRFESGCAGAVIHSSRSPSALEVVLDTGESERLTDLEPAASYVVRLAPKAVEAGRSIARLTVEASRPTTTAAFRTTGPHDGTVFRCAPGTGLDAG